MTMGDRIAVMNKGLLQQVSAPQELYEKPANTFVAGFIGSPGMNLITGRAEQAGAAVAFEGGSISLPERFRRAAAEVTGVVVGVRPEALTLDPQGSFGATVSIVELLGAEVHVITKIEDGSRVVVRQEVSRPRPHIGERVRVSVVGDALTLFEVDSGARIEERS